MSANRPIRFTSISIILILLLGLIVGCKGGDGVVSPGGDVTTVEFVPIKSLQYASAIPLTIRLQSDQRTEVTLAVTFSEGLDDPFRTATSLPGKVNPASLQNIVVPATGTEVVFWWYAVADLEYADRQVASTAGENLKHGGIYFRATVTEKDGAVGMTTEGPFTVDYSNPTFGENPPYVEGGELPTVSCGNTYNVLLQHEGGDPPTVWSLFPPGVNLPYFLELTWDGKVKGSVPEWYGPTTIAFYAMVSDSNVLAPRYSTGRFTIPIECGEPPIPGCAPPPEITFDSLPAGTENSLYLYECTANAGEGNLTWSIAAGQLPDGLNLNPVTGIISGTPTPDSAGVYALTIEVCDSCPAVSQCDTVEINLTIQTEEFGCASPPMIVTQNLATAVETQPYEFTFAALEGEGELTWSITAGGLPSGIELSPSGVVSGTLGADTGGTGGVFYPFTVEVCDACGAGAQCDSRELSLLVQPPPICAPLTILRDPVIDPELPLAVEGIVYEYIFTTVENEAGEGTLTWELLNPAVLPAGLTWVAGTISGTPETGAGAAGPYSLNVSVTDECPVQQEDSDWFAFDVKGPCVDPPVITTTELPDGDIGTPYAIQMFSTDGQGAKTWDIISVETLPNGLNMTSSGMISGTPAAGSGGPHPGIEIQVTDACWLEPQSDSQLYNLTILGAIECAVQPSITTTELAVAGEGAEYNFTLDASNGELPLTWVVLSDEDPLPSSLILGTDGTISGIPDAGTAGSYNLHFQVCDSCPDEQCDDRILSLEIITACDPGPTITTLSVDDAYATFPYSFQFEATGGDLTNNDLRWLLDDPDSLPQSLILSVEGVLEGTPDATDLGDWEFSVTVIDGCPLGSQSDGADFVLSILPPSGCAPPPVISSGTSYSAPAGGIVNFQFAATGGHGNLSWTLEDSVPSLPVTVALTPDGRLLGTTDTSDEGSYELTVQVCDECDDPSPQCDSIVFTLSLVGATGCTNPPPAIQDDTIPEPIPDSTPYSHTMTAVDGDPPLFWIAIGLPNGILMNPMSGELSGAVDPGDIGLYVVYIGVLDGCPLDSQADSAWYIWDLTD